jgi:PilZ domain-containing protein
MTRLEVWRAPRYVVTLALRYRQGTDMPWLHGVTQNISSSGVLFQADRTLTPNAPVEMNLIMPPQVVGPAATRVVCYGRVVRTMQSPTPDVPPALAATIAEYRLVRSDEEAS